jgi:hypothetical protein
MGRILTWGIVSALATGVQADVSIFPALPFLLPRSSPTSTLLPAEIHGITLHSVAPEFPLRGKSEDAKLYHFGEF